jgi:hypothetical protein
VRGPGGRDGCQQSKAQGRAEFHGGVHDAAGEASLLLRDAAGGEDRRTGEGERGSGGQEHDAWQQAGGVGRMRAELREQEQPGSRDREAGTGGRAGAEPDDERLASRPAVMSVSAYGAKASEVRSGVQPRACWRYSARNRNVTAVPAAEKAIASSAVARRRSARNAGGSSGSRLRNSATAKAASNAKPVTSGTTTAAEDQACPLVTTSP